MREFSHAWFACRNGANMQTGFVNFVHGAERWDLSYWGEDPLGTPPVTSTWTEDFLTREGEGRKTVGDWLRDKTISLKTRRRLLQTNADVFHVREENGTNIQMGSANCAGAVESWSSNCWTEDPPVEHWASGHHWASAELCVTPPSSSGNRAHNAFFQLVQDDMNKARSVNKNWEFVSKGTEISLGKFVSEYFTPLTIDSRSGVVSTEDIDEIWKATEKVRGGSNRPVGRLDSPMTDETEVEKS